jgi:general secretion pathway protein D
MGGGAAAGGINIAPRVSGGGATLQTPSATQAVFGGNVRIAADENTNSLLITAGKQDYEIVLNLLEKLDIAKDQVYVEAVILELTLENSFNYDLTYYHFPNGKETKGAVRMGFSTHSNVMDLLNPAAGRGAILGFGGGDKFDITTPTGTVTINSLLGFLTFIKGHTNTNILSTPQILALDNEESVIEVGEEVPVGSAQSISTTGQLSSPVFKDATIKLAIKPFISRDEDVVRLNVEQAVRDVSERQIQAKSLADSTQAISKREIKTNIVLRSGDTAVLGGLVQDRVQISETKVPLLGDIPLLGWLFKGRSSNTRKVNLLVFLTPKVIRSIEGHNDVLKEKLSERRNFLRDNGGAHDPHKKFFSELEAKAEANTYNRTSVPQQEFEQTPFTTEDDFFLEVE